MKSVPSPDEAKAKLDAILQNVIKQNEAKKKEEMENGKKLELAKPKKDQKIIRPNTEGNKMKMIVINYVII